jgi:hypothetical protein
MLNLQSAESLMTTILFLCAYALTATVTEVGQAWVAHRLGDDSAAEDGWLNLNPLAHVDIIGVLFVLFLNFPWVRMVPVSPFHTNASKTRLCMIYFSQAVISVVFALIILALLLFWLGPTCLSLTVSMVAQEHIPLKTFLGEYPEKSTLAVIAILFMISLVIYGIFIATISLIANGFRFFYMHYWQVHRAREQYPDYVIWIAGFIAIMFLAEPVRRTLLIFIVESTRLIGYLCGTM